MIVCITSDLSSRMKYKITLHKSYEVLSHDKYDYVYCIINDIGELTWYDSNMFMTLEEFRNSQIDKLV